jgi:hypothetical protein
MEQLVEQITKKIRENLLGMMPPRSITGSALGSLEYNRLATAQSIFDHTSDVTTTNNGFPSTADLTAAE